MKAQSLPQRPGTWQRERGSANKLTNKGTTFSGSCARRVNKGRRGHKKRGETHLDMECVRKGSSGWQHLT